MVSDDMLEAFAVIGEYDEIADKILEKYGGLLDEVGFAPPAEHPMEETQLKRIIRRLQEGD